MISTRIRGVSPDKTDWRKSKTEHGHNCYIPLALKYPLQKNQSGKTAPSGFLFARPTRGRCYNIVTDNANEPSPLLTAPYETATGLEAPLTLPEYVVEVALSC